jgi:hypothetical protein
VARKKKTGTIFKIYLLAKSQKDLEEGWIKLWKHKGKLVRGKMKPFNRLDRVSAGVRQLLKRHKIEWP